MDVLNVSRFCYAKNCDSDIIVHMNLQGAEEYE